MEKESAAKPVRTRFAPSPTGSLHVGGVRTALFNYLFARKNRGTFVLRIEDTDVARSTEASESVIIRDLHWLGLSWDEGPRHFEEVSGDEGEFGPYRQSERLEIYRGILEKLAGESRVYRCYCTEEELSARRKLALSTGQTPRYDGRCRDLPAEKQKAFELERRPFALRFKITDKGKITVNDLVHGEVHFDADLIGDFVLMKSNGYPSYNFACVADDHLMRISHVIRGDEHLTNTPRQMMVYRALGWEVPQFAHLSMILAPDHTKLSKRHGTTAVVEFKDKGFLPHGLINYLALLGWSPKDEREFFLPEGQYADSRAALHALLAELSRYFSLEGVSKNPAVFDDPKLAWMNSRYIRALPVESLAEEAGPLFEKAGVPVPPSGKLTALLASERDTFNTLADAVSFAREFRVGQSGVAGSESVIDEQAKPVLSWEWTPGILSEFLSELSMVSELTAESVSLLLKNIQKKSGKKGKELYWPVRVAVTGKTHGPELAHILPLLGKSEVISRVENFLQGINLKR